MLQVQHITTFSKQPETSFDSWQLHNLNEKIYTPITLIPDFSAPACQEEFKNLEVEYMTMPGWNQSTEHVRSFSDLPENAQKYIQTVEELMGVPGN